MSVLLLKYFFGSFRVIKRYYKISFYEYLILDDDTTLKFEARAMQKLHEEIANRK